MRITYGSARCEGHGDRYKQFARSAHRGGLLTLGAHAQRGLRYLVCPSVCLTDLNSGTTGNKAARVRYTRLQRNNRSKNNVVDLAKTAAFWQERPAPPWTKFRDPTHQLALCACVFITCTTGSQPLEQHCPESCVAVNATSSAASLFQNCCIRYQGM